ncbi:DUF4429 domain-containing protein [Nonomuraea longicatena]
MADVLSGIGGSWQFAAEGIRMRYERTSKTARLLQELGERLVPFSAVDGAVLAPGKRGTVVLRLTPRPGADPLIIAAGGQLRESQDPYRLVLPADRETLAEYYRDEVRALITVSGPLDQPVVAGPSVPRSFKGWDGQASFDGQVVRFHWYWSGASTRKYDAGDQEFAVSAIEGVEWRSPDIFDGYMRLKLRGVVTSEAPDQDPASITFGMGTGLTHESLPVAAAIVAAVGRVRPTTIQPPARPTVVLTAPEPAALTSPDSAVLDSPEPAVPVTPEPAALAFSGPGEPLSAAETRHSPESGDFAPAASGAGRPPVEPAASPADPRPGRPGPERPGPHQGPPGPRQGPSEHGPQGHSGPNPSGAALTPAAAIADRIRHLGALRDEGLISEDEFQAKKTQLLAEL